MYQRSKIFQFFSRLGSAFPIVLLCLTFLVLVLTAGAYRQYQIFEDKYHKDVQHSVDDYAAKVGLTAEAVLKVNHLFSTSNGKSFVDFKQDVNSSLDVKMLQRMQQVFFNFNGYFLLTLDGKVYKQHAQLLHENEQQQIELAVQAAKGKDTIFAYHFGNDGAFYIATPWSYADQQGYLVVRRPFAVFSQVISEGKFTGFELALLNQQTKQLFIRKNMTPRYDLAVYLSEKEQKRTIYAKDLPPTPWRVVALPDMTFRSEVVREIVVPPLVIVLLFLFSALLLLSVLSRYKAKQLAAEAANRLIEQRAEQTLGAIEDTVITTDLKGEIRYINGPGWELLKRLQKNAVIGHQLQDTLPISAAGWMQGDYSVLENHSSHEIEIEIDGQSQYLEQRIHSLFDGDKLDGMVWILRDINSRVANRQALAASQQRYKDIYDGAGMALWMVKMQQLPALLKSWQCETPEQLDTYMAQHPDAYRDLEKVFSLAESNESSHKLFAAKDSDELLKDVRSVLAEDGQRMRIKTARAYLEGRKKMEFETRARRLDGRMLDLWISISFVASDEILISYTDVTARKLTLQVLQEREEFWSSVINALPDIIYVNDLSKRRGIYSNRQIGHLLGYDDTKIAELGEGYWQKLLHADDVEVAKSKIDAMRNMPPGTVTESTFRLKAKDGSWRIIRFRDTILSSDEFDMAQQYVGMARDVTESVEAQELLSENERQYRLLAENVSDIIWATDLNLNFTYVSTSIERVLGYGQNEVLRAGVQSIFPSKQVRQLIKMFREDLREAEQQGMEYSGNRFFDIDAVTVSGVPMVLELHSSLLRDEQGVVQGMLGVCRDVTARRLIEKEVRQAAGVFENSTESILICDPSGIVLKTNRAFTELTGYRQDDVIGKMPTVLQSEQHDVHFYPEIIDALLIEGYWQGELYYRCHNGEERPSWTGITAIKDDLGHVQSHIVISSDIADRKQVEQHIHKLAYFDALTSLPNRSQMHDHLNHALNTAKQEQTCVALLFIDLDRFKPINDSMGHPVGDQVLELVAQRLEKVVAGRGLLARIGGDEFTLLISGFKDPTKERESIEAIGQEILEALRQAFNVNERELFIGGSIGVSIFPETGLTGAELLRNSDIAMYHAKAKGRNALAFFVQEMNDDVTEKLELENALHGALERGEFELFYQPQWDLKTGLCVGAEALLRWHHPNKGIVSPVHFIPILEESGLIVAVGEWILFEACDQLSKWRKAGLSMERIAVNLSARQFQQKGLIDAVQQALDSAGIAARQLEVEITESLLIDDVERTLNTLKQLKLMGVRVSIDDFGTGYSSLSYLKQFPVDTLKVDRSFIMNIPDNKDDEQITRTIISMAHNLGLGVIAEGVETAEQLSFLKQLGCEEVQGFLLSPPVRAAAMEDTINNSQMQLE